SVGQDRFLDALQAYVRKFAFRHPTTEDLLSSLEQELGSDTSSLLRAIVEKNARINYQIRDTRVKPSPTPTASPSVSAQGNGTPNDTGKLNTEVLIANIGDVAARTEVDFAFADGSRQRETWDGHGHVRRFELTSSAPLVEVNVDPSEHLSYEANRVDNWRRERPSWKASLRAAARLGFWEQTILQMLGI
ncbi:MAG: hypothetical protein V2A73_04035, partial [Pseudomonadota bacterium]